jgi:hypothetical protein
VNTVFAIILIGVKVSTTSSRMFFPKDMNYATNLACHNPLPKRLSGALDEETNMESLRVQKCICLRTKISFFTKYSTSLSMSISRKQCTFWKGVIVHDNTQELQVLRHSTCFHISPILLASFGSSFSFVRHVFRVR